MKTLKQLFFILSLGFFSSLAAFAEPLQNTLERAQQGDAVAQFDLGYMYASGQGVKQDYLAAKKWFEKAAEQGYPSAQGALGAMYFGGMGVKQNKAKAKRYFRLACGNGSQQGCDDYRKLNEQGY